jgi:hypothetical protein
VCLLSGTQVRLGRERVAEPVERCDQRVDLVEGVLAMCPVSNENSRLTVR